jgi:hypothetical protein
MGIITTPNSYNFSNTVRSVDEQFDLLRAKAPLLLSLIARGANATNTKHEWGEDQLTPTRSAVASFDTDGDGVGVNITSTTGFRAGMILGVEKATGASVTEQLKVTSVDSATELTVVRDYGSITGVTLVVGDILFVIFEPKAEGTSASTGRAWELALGFNYSEIFDAIAQVSKTSQAIKMYGVDSAIAKAEEVELVNMLYRLNNAVIYGRKVQRSSSENGTMGGILQFLANGNVDTTGGALSSTIINNLFEAALSDGGFSSNYAILCNFNQARRISAFNTSGTNPAVRVDNRDFRAGQAISEFMGDIPVINGVLGSSSKAFIVPDQNFPKDQIALIDLDRITLRYLDGREMTSEPANKAGDDFYATRILGELTLEVKNGQKAHAIATGLTL